MSITGLIGPEARPDNPLAASMTPSGGNRAAIGYQIAAPAKPHVNTVRRDSRSPTAEYASAPRTEPAAVTPIISPRLHAVP